MTKKKTVDPYPAATLFKSRFEKAKVEGKFRFREKSAPDRWLMKSSTKFVEYDQEEMADFFMQYYPHY